MTEIPEQVMDLLRRQGLTQDQIEQLRVNGHLDRIDMMGPAGLPPEAIRKLKRIQRLLPQGMVEEFERQAGQDLDGDGRIGARATTPTASTTSTASVSSGAMPGSHAVGSSSGPFVGATPKRGGRGLYNFVFAIVVIAAVLVVGWYIVR